MIGKRLRESRKRAGLLQVQLAAALGDRYDAAMVSRVETGLKSMRLDGAVNAARELRVSLDYLAGLTDDPTPSAELATKVELLADDVALADPGPGARPIPVHRLQSAAGGGALDLDESVKTHAWFRREWLSRRGLTASRCCIINVTGESMEPTLPDGCVILLDRNRTRRHAGHIFVVRTEDGLVVKRAGKNAERGWQLLSDHPSWAPVPWPGGAEVIGEVKWMAREL